MSVLVVDASVAAKWFFDEAHSEAAHCVLDDRHFLHAPDLVLLEVDNVVCKRIRRREITMAEGAKIRATLRRMPIVRHGFEGLLDVGYAIANETGRSLYDCVYVALAELLDGVVVTADRRLREGVSRSLFAGRVVWVEEFTPAP